MNGMKDFLMSSSRLQWRLSVVVMIISLLIMGFAPRTLQQLSVLQTPWSVIPGLFLVALFWTGLMLGVEIGQTQVLAQAQRKESDK